MTTLKRPQRQPDPNEAYIPVRGGINAYTRSLNETTDTPIADFYKSGKVLKSLKQVDVSGYARYPKVANPVDLHIAVDDKGNKIITPQTLTIKLKEPNELIDYDAIKKKLVSHPKDVKTYYEGLTSSSVLLTKTIFHLVPPNNSPEFEAMARCFKPEIMVDEHGGGGYSMYKVNPKKVDRLLGLIQAQPQKTGYTLNVLYEANTDTDLSVMPRTDDQIGYFASNIPVRKIARYTLLLDLVEKCGITPEGMTRQTLNMNGVERALTDTHAIVERILTDALAYMLDVYEADSLTKNGDFPNVPDSENNAIMGLPTALVLVDMTKKTSTKSIKTLEFGTRNKAEVKKGGLEAIMDDIDRKYFLSIQDDRRRAEEIKEYIALQTRTLVAFDEWKKDHPNDDKVVISDLAKYTRFAKRATSGKGLRPEQRQEILLGLERLGRIRYRYIIGKIRRKDGNGVYHTYYDRDYIYIFTRVTGDEIDEKTGRKMSVKIDYTPEYKQTSSQNLGVVANGLGKVKNDTATLIGLYLCQRMVAEQKKVAEDHEPIKTDLATLITVGLLFDTNITQLCATIKKALDELEEKGVIGKWQALKNSKPNGKLLELDKENNVEFKIWAKNPTVYRTKSQERALRASKAIYQREWLDALKKLHNPNKAYTNPTTLAKDLGITKQQLDVYLGGKEIPEELGDKILELKEEMGL